MDGVDSAAARALEQLTAVLREIAVAQTAGEVEISETSSPEEQQWPKAEVQSDHRETAR